MVSVRRGQAALEFMMTYGWAILTVLAAIGALAYFGVLSPSRFAPDTCLANNPFSCPGNPVLTTTNITFSLTNGKSYSITLDNSTSNLTLSPSLTALGCSNSNVRICPMGTLSCPAGSLSVGSNQGATIILNCAGLSNSGSVKGDVIFRYTDADSRLPAQILVSLSGRPK